MTQWFTSDTHIGHTNIIKHCNRPFDSIEDMNRQVVNNINTVVRPGDHLYHLGDIGWGREAVLWFLHNVECKQIHVVWGNHDNRDVRRAVQRHPKVISTEWLDTVRVEGSGNDTIKITLCHFPMLSWMGRYHLHGHRHAQGEMYHRWVMDVSVDGNDFYPYSWEDIKKIFNARESKNEDGNCGS